MLAAHQLLLCLIASGDAAATDTHMIEAFARIQQALVAEDARRRRRSPKAAPEPDAPGALPDERRRARDAGILVAADLEDGDLYALIADAAALFEAGDDDACDRLEASILDAVRLRLALCRLSGALGDGELAAAIRRADAALEPFAAATLIPDAERFEAAAGNQVDRPAWLRLREQLDRELPGERLLAWLR